jgi:hypothetical protein
MVGRNGPSAGGTWGRLTELPTEGGLFLVGCSLRSTPPSAESNLAATIPPSGSPLGKCSTDDSRQIALHIDDYQCRQLRRPYGSKVSAVIRNRWRTAPDSSATSSRHSGPSLSLAMVSRIISEHAVAASSQAASSSPRSTGTSLE